jgi:8-oxo-dGTP pyrophosphatase MutT (NUDIX family)
MARNNQLAGDMTASDRNRYAMLTDFAWRCLYKAGFPLARQWWRLRRPSHRGVVVGVWIGGRVLVVRQSYRADLSMPGGGVKRGEQPLDAAVRELAEEIGVRAKPGDLLPAGGMRCEWDFRDDDVSFFDLRLVDEPLLMPDRREIVAAWFTEPRAVLPEIASPFIRFYLERHLA